MATPIPASAIAGKRLFIPTTGTTDTTSTADSPSTPPVLATVPGRNPSALYQPADHVGQQNPPPSTSHPLLILTDNGTPASATPDKSRQDAPPPGTGRESDGEDNDDAGNDRGIDKPFSTIGTLGIGQPVAGAEETDTATSYHDIGKALQTQGKYAEAVEYFLKALAIQEKVLGTDHPDTIASYDSIGALLHDQGKDVLALEYLLKVITLRERVLGTNHPLTVKSLLTLRSVLDKQGLYAQALAYFRKALAAATTTGNDANTVIYRRYIDLLALANPKS